MELIEDKTEGGYTVIFPELPGCLTCGETLQEAYENAIDAKSEWIIAALEEGIKIPDPEPVLDLYNHTYSGQFKLRIPKSLHRSLAEHSKKEGISMNQYCIYLLSKNNAVYEAEHKLSSPS